MSLSNSAETSFLLILFNATLWANIAINATSSPIPNLYNSLHTADPGEAGDQTTSEATYTSYARVAVARTTSGWPAPSGGSISPAATITFPTATGGTNTITHFSIGVAASSTSKILYSGTVTPNIAVVNGVIPELSTSTTITED